MSAGQRREALAAALVGAVAFLPFLRGALSGASLYFRDLALYFLPLRRLGLEGLRAGEVRFWNPLLHEGVPLSLPAVGYPLDVLQVLRPDEAGISLVLSLHVPLAALAFYALARRLLDAAPAAAAGGALVYALGGFVLSSVNLYVYVEAAAWAPLVVLTLARLGDRASRRGIAGAALAVAVALSTTGVEVVAQAVIVGLVLGRGRQGGGTARRLASAGAALVLGVLVAAPVLLLVASQVGGSARSQGFATDVVLAHSVHPFTLLQTVVGGLYGNLSRLAEEWWGQNFFPRGFPYVLSLYLGATALALAAVGATTRSPWRGRLLLLAAGGLVVSLGRWAGLAEVVDAVPAVSAFRYPVKAFFTVHLALSLLVALGLSRLESGDGRGGWRRLTVAAGGLGGLLALTPLLPRLWPAPLARFGASFFPPGLDPQTGTVLLSRILADAAAGGALALAAAALAATAARGALRPAPATLLVVAVLGADLLRTGAGLNPMVTGSFFRPSAELTARLPSLRRGRAFTCSFEASHGYHAARRARGPEHETWTFAVALETLTPAFNVPLGVPTALSPDLTMLVPENRVLAPAEAGCRDLDALVPRLRRAGVRTVLSLDPLEHPALRPAGALSPARLAPLSVRAYAVAGPLPLIGVATRVVPVANATEGEERAAAAGFLDGGAAAVEGGTATDGVGGHVEAVRVEAGAMEVRVETDAATVLVVRHGWAAGWRAWVDGEPATVRRSDGRHLAVAVPAGRSGVVLRYRPTGLRAGLGLSVLGLGVVLGLAWRRRRPRAAPGPRG